MRPNAKDSLISIAGYMGKEMVPRIDDAYTANMTALVSGLMLMLAHEQEHGADNLIAENTAIRALYDSYAAKLAAAPAKAEWDELRCSLSSDHLASTLRAQNDDLKRLLIGVHAWVETADEDWARELDAAIWALMHDSRRRESIEYVLDLFNSPG